MAVFHIIEALLANWERVYALLDDQAREELRDRVSAMREATTPQERNKHANRVIRVLMANLEDDPVLDADGHRFGSARKQDADSALLALTSRLPVFGGPARTVEERLLANGWEPAHVLRGRGVDPDVPDLIGVDRNDGSRAVPVFQFDDQGTPISIVIQVNRVLGAREDPWGVADWWLSANVWLHEIPSALIGRTSDDLLLAAAVAAVQG
ncbi:hypothetical protein [Umezawaea sp. NPDC059074]|uniref:hypothetical protein n=1 Tax=Umezawaea sp. NPDC059074 TaxID=3346716 RepID=UPI0036975644